MTDPISEAKTDAPVVTERVQEILDIGARIFAEKGYDGTSMRDIAVAAGVSKALLYHHFSSKDDIYARISFNSTRNLYDYVEAQIPAEGSAADKVRAFMIAAATFFAENRSAWIAASTAFWTDPDRHRMERRIARRRAFEQRLRGLIREGVESGEFREIDPAAAGRLILSGINWMHRWYDPKGAMSAEEIVNQYADIVVHGLACRQPSP